MTRNAKQNGGIIYLITNLVNGKYYVGQTKNLRIRKNQHFSAARTGKLSFPINKAIRKYGDSNFLIEELAAATTQRDLDNLEAAWIISLSSHKRQFGYNRRLGGGGSSCCEETRRLQSQVHTGKPSPKKGIRRVPVEVSHQKRIDYARRRRAEIKAARALLPADPKPLRVISGETRRRMSKAHRGKPGNRKGQPVSEETRTKLRASWERKRVARPPLPPKPPKVKRVLTPEQHTALIERMRSPELRAKISAGKIGGKRPDNAARNKAVMFTPSANAKRRNTLNNYYQTERGKAHTQKAISARLSVVTHEQLSEAGIKGNQARWGKR